MKLAIDPGHGMGNRTPGLYDPGATNQAFHEAHIVLRYGLELEAEAQRRGWDTYMTRRDNDTPTPLGKRVRGALETGCTVLLSLHCNAAFTSAANGTETLYGTAPDLARHVQAAVVGALRLRDRRAKYQPDLAMLRFQNAALIELGFITNPYDLAVLMQPDMPAKVATAVCDALSPLHNT